MMAVLVMQKMLGKWRRDRVCLLPPNDESHVVTMLSRIGKNFSRDVVNLYCAVGGMKEGEMDSLTWSLWSLNRLVSENLHCPRPYIMFADFLIESHFYCLKYKNEEESSVHIDYFDGREPEQIANSLTEFFGLYLECPRRINL